MLNNPSNECTSIFNVHLNLKDTKLKTESLTKKL